MTLDIVNAIASTLTLAVLSASVVTGIAQLRHLRAGNELEAVLAVERDFRSAPVQAALAYVQTELAQRMQDPGYRADLGNRGYVDPAQHPEMRLCNWFNWAGALVREGYLNEELFLTTFGRLVTFYWTQLGPVIAVLRRTRGAGQYDSFEYLAARAQRRERSQRVRHAGNA